MPMTSHSHGHGAHSHAVAGLEAKKGMVAAAGVVGLSAGGVDKHQQHQKLANTPTTPTAATAVVPPNPLHSDGERCKARVPAKVPLTEINQFLICQLCFGYLVDATAIIECQHAFCKSCILKYLENKNNSYCPICEVQLNEAKPHSSLRSDEILQKLVYKLVPGLFVTEVRRRRDFLNKSSANAENNGFDSSAPAATENASANGETTKPASTPKNGVVSAEDIIASMDMKEDGEDLVFLSPEDSVSLSLEYFKSTSTGVKEESAADSATNAKASANANSNAKTGTAAEKQSQKQAAAAGKEGSTANAENKIKNDTNSNSNTVANAIANAKNTCSDNKANDRRYLQCPAAVSVGLLKKFIRMKYGLSDDYRVDLLYNGDRDSNLENDLTLLDLALIFKWKKATPMCFHYRIFDRPFKPTNTRPGSKRPFSSLMDQEPPNDDDDAASTGPPNKSPAHGKLTRFASSSASDGTKHGTDGGTGKTQPKNRSASLSSATGEQSETKIGIATATPKEDSMKFRPLNAAGRAGLINLEEAIEESKVKPKLSVDTKPFIVGSVPCGQKLSVVMPKVPPLIVTSPSRSDPGSPLKISFGHVSTSPSSKSSSVSGSPEGKGHHHHHRGDGHHHHHHKHHRHHKEKHRKHSKNKSKDRDKEKGSSSSSSDKAKHREKRKEEKAKAQQAAQANAAAAAGSASTVAGSSQTDTKEKETRYKYNAHPNPSQSQTISVSVKSGKFPASLLTQASGGNAGPPTNMANVGARQNTAPGAIGKLESIVSKKITGQNTSASGPGPGTMPMKKSAGIFPERRASTSSTASSSSQASLSVSLKPKQGPGSSGGTNNAATGSNEGAQQSQQQQRNIVLPDSVHLQVPKSVTLIPVNPNSGQVLSGSGSGSKQQRAGNLQQQQQGTGRLSSSGGSATTFTHPLTNKSLHQITVTEVPPPTSKSLTGSSSSSSVSKQFNGPGSMEITKIYCDKSSANSSTKVFDPQGKKLKGLDISISNAGVGSGSARGGSGEQQQGQGGGSKNSITLSKTGLPKIPGVSILPQSMAKSGKLPKNSISLHAMSISAASATGNSGSSGLLNKIKEKHIQQQQGHGHGPNSNRLSITTIQQQQQQQQSLLKIPMTNDNRKAGMNALRRSSSPHSGSGSGSGTPPRKFQQHTRITPSPPSKLGQLLHGPSQSQSQDQMITAKMINRRSSIEITPVSAMSQKPNKIKRPFESTFNKHAGSPKLQSGSGSASPPGKREKLTSNEQQKHRTKRESECPLDLSGKSSRSTPPASSSDYDSSNSSFSADRPATPNISITAQSPPNHKPSHTGKASGKSHNVAHGTQTISSIAQTLTQKQQQQQQQQQHAKEQKASSGNRDRDRGQSHHGGPGGLALSPPIISPSSHGHHSPNSGAAVATSPTAGFHPLGNLLTLSNAAAHLRKMNHHNHPLNNLAVAAAAGAGGFCPNLLRPPIPQQHSPSSQCLNSLSSPPISPNAITSSGLLSHFNHHQMSMSNLMNSPLMQMNSAAAAAAASLLDPTSPASLFCARMGFPQPNPSSPLNPNAGNAGGLNVNPFFPSLTRPPHSSPSSALRIPNVINVKSGHGHGTTTKSPPMSHNSNSQSSKSHSHSPKSSSGSLTSAGTGKPLKINGNITGANTSHFVAPSSINPMMKPQTQSAKSAIPNSMKISNFLPTTKSTSSNTNATITSSCGDYESLLMPELPLGNLQGGVGIGTKTEIGASASASGIKPEPQPHSQLTPTSCEAKTETPASASASTGKKVQKTSTNVRYVCLPGGKLVPAKAATATENEQLVAAAAAVSVSESNESTKLLSSKSESTQQEQEAVITKLHDDEKDAGRLGALGLALGLVPREREQRERDEKEQVPLLSLTGTSSSALQTTTTTTMGRTTQQQNLAVRHIPNPSLIFSRNIAATAASSSSSANANVTVNNQIPSPTTTKAKAEVQMKVEDEGEEEKDNDKCIGNEIKKESKPNSTGKEQETAHVKLETAESESECSDSKAVVADLVNEVSKLPVAVAEAEESAAAMKCKLEAEAEEPSNMADMKPESSVKGEEVEISKNIDGGVNVTEEANLKKEEIKPETEEPDESTAELRKEEEKCADSVVDNEGEGEDKVDAPSTSFGDGFQSLDQVENQLEPPFPGVAATDLCTPLENEKNNDAENEKEKDSMNFIAAVEEMECEEPELDTEALKENDNDNDGGDPAEVGDVENYPDLQPDHENALVMVNEDDDDDDCEQEEVNFNELLKEDSCSVDADAYVEGDDEANSNRTTEDSTSCDELMEIDSTEPATETEPEPETESKEEADPVVNLGANENEEPTNANALASVLLSVEELVTQVENDNNNTIAVFPNLDNHSALRLELEEEVPMEIDEFDGRGQEEQDLRNPIPDIIVTESEDVPVPNEQEAVQATSVPNGSTLSPPPIFEETSVLSPLPSILAPLSVVTTSPIASPSPSPQLSSAQSPSDNSPSGSSRPNSLPIAGSPSPINKLAYLKSGSCSPVSPSSVKSGEHNLRKMENLEKVAAGLLATATNINNNTISTSAATAASPMTAAASANCDLTISATAAAVPAPNSSSMSNVNATSTNSSLQQQPPVSNV